MRIQVFCGGDDPVWEFDTGPDPQLADYRRLRDSVSGQRNPVAKVRRDLIELESGSPDEFSGTDGTADEEFPSVTLWAAWARLHSGDELDFSLKPSERLDLILAAVEATFPEAEVKLA